MNNYTAEDVLKELIKDKGLEKYVNSYAKNTSATWGTVYLDHLYLTLAIELLHYRTFGLKVYEWGDKQCRTQGALLGRFIRVYEILPTRLVVND